MGYSKVYCVTTALEAKMEFSEVYCVNSALVTTLRFYLLYNNALHVHLFNSFTASVNQSCVGPLPPLL